MAKKQKQKKSGMLKRQQQKRQKKMLTRRKNMPSRIQQAGNSPQQLEQLLSILPTLAFEPELSDLSMSEMKFRELQGTDISELELFSSLLTEDFLALLETRLSQLEAVHPPKSVKSLLARATIHQLDNSEEIPHLSNPVLVAIFLKTQAQISGIPLTLISLPLAIEEFEKRNHEEIEKLTLENENLETTSADNQMGELVDESLEDEVVEKRPSAIDAEVYNKYLETISAENKEQVEDDLELFLVDYEVPLVAEWDKTLVKNFMNKWFLETANPLEEDLQSMRESLSHLFQYLDQENLLPEGLLNEVSGILKT